MEAKPPKSGAISKRLLENARRLFPAAGEPFQDGDQVAASLVLKPSPGDIVVCLMADRQRYIIGQYWPIKPPAPPKRRRARRIGDFSEEAICRIRPLPAGSAEIELAGNEIAAVMVVLETIHRDEKDTPQEQNTAEPARRAGRPPKRHAKRTR